MKMANRYVWEKWNKTQTYKYEERTSQVDNADNIFDDASPSLYMSNSYSFDSDDGYYYINNAYVEGINVPDQPYFMELEYSIINRSYGRVMYSGIT